MKKNFHTPSILKSILLNLFLILLLIIAFILTGCQNSSNVSETSATTSLLDCSDEDYDTDYSDENPQTVTLEQDHINFSGEGATVSGNTLTITQGGAYILTGTLENGHIIVDADKNDLVRIVLSNAQITADQNAAIYSRQSSKTIVTLAENTENSLIDASTRDTSDSEAPTAALYVQDNLTINGSGHLNVSGSFNDAITSKDTLRILSSNVTVTSSADDGLIGRDAAIIADSTITINASGDGIKSTHDEDASKGSIQIADSHIQITTGNDGIQAQTDLTIYSGDFNITTGDGAVNRSTSENWGEWKDPRQDEETDGTETEASAKALKSSGSLQIKDGYFSINSSDDAVHSNQTINILGGTFEIQSGDDGIHADESLTIDQGTLSITQSYEGLEAMVINLNDGQGNIVASDDGINAAGGDGSSQNGRPGQNPMDTQNVEDSDIALNINGGTWYFNAAGDGLDSNASITQSSGTVVIDGPESGGNSALDYDGTYNITGGTLVAFGSSEMLQIPSSETSLGILSLTFTDKQSAETTVKLTDASGQVLFDQSPVKTFQNITLCSAEIQSGSTYTLSYGDQSLSITPSSSITQIDENGNTLQSFGTPGSKSSPQGPQNNMTPPNGEPSDKF